MATSDEVTRAVLEAARAAYARRGYLNTTIKGVAATAGVAPDVVRRYYANREATTVGATGAVLPLGVSDIVYSYRKWSWGENGD